MKVYISTCDKYIDLLKPFSFLFNKFWSISQDVIVLGYKRPDFLLPNNFEFISMSDTDNVKNWSTDLRNFFESIDDKYFIYGLEDYFLLEPVRLDILNILIKYCVDKTARICLNSDLKCRPYATHCVVDGNTIIKADQNTDYRVSTQLSIWNREYFLKYLEPGIDPWQFEVYKSKLAKNDGWDIFGTLAPFTVEYSIGRRKNNPRLSFNYINSRPRSLDQTVIDEMKEKNLI